jgi:hypothetical protein
MTRFEHDARCSRSFVYRDLIQVGETWVQCAAGLDAAGRDAFNLPEAEASWRALAGLAEHVLEPMVERFGRPTLTYGFAGAALSRRRPSRTAPELDQHAAYETRRTRDGRTVRICERGGAAVDVLFPGVGAFAVGAWLVTEGVPFDRLYLYGEDRPLHVSWVDPSERAPASEVWFVDRASGRPVPRRLVAADVDALAACLRRS